MRLRVHSLQAQLALKLAAVFSLATVLAVCAVFYEGRQAAKTLGDDELQERAIQLTRFISRGADGTWHLELPPRQRQIYDSPARTRLLAARTCQRWQTDCVDGR